MVQNGVPRGELDAYSTVPITISGSFADPTAGFVQWGKGFTAAAGVTGTFTVVFQDSYPVVESFVASLETDAVGDQIVLVGPWDASTKTLTIYVYDISSGLADPDFDSGDKIHFQASFDNSGVWA